MRYVYFLILVTFFASAQENRQWKTVLDLEGEGKITSASKVVNRIFDRAKARGNDADRIKALIFKSKYDAFLEAKYQQSYIDNIERELKSASVPGNAILRIMYAKSLQSYLSRNRYFRRESGNVSAEDFSTWTQNFIENRIDSLYKASLTDAGSLADYPLSPYEPILVMPETPFPEQRSVLDFVLIENLEFRRTRDYDHVEETRVLPLFWADVRQFAGADFSQYDSDLRYVLELYQMAEKHFGAYGHLDRLRFVFNALDKDSHAFLGALDRIRTDDAKLRQRILSDKITALSPYGFRLVEVVAKADSIIALGGNTNMYRQALAKRESITAPKLFVSIPAQFYPNQHVKARLEYANLDSVHVRIYKMNMQQYSHPEARALHRVQEVMRQSPVASAAYRLPFKPDYGTRTTEVLMPQLGVGFYMIVISDTRGKGQSVSMHNVTSLAGRNSLRDDVVTLEFRDRKTGKPLENIAVELGSAKGKTAPDGAVSLPPAKYSEKLIAYSHGDTLSVQHPFAVNYPSSNKDTIARTHFYFDRPIYRPGHKVKFKGILSLGTAYDSWVAKGVRLTVTLTDSNGKKVDTIAVKTNEYGSFSGEFELSQGCATGRYQVNARLDEDNTFDFADRYSGRHSFRVEEYKRPKFEVNFDRIAEDLLPGKPARVKGVALSYSDAPISDATVRYRISYYDSHFERRTLSQGTLTTANDGTFTIDFTPENRAPSYGNDDVVYTVTADVTDVSGETQSGAIDASVGSVTRLVSLVAPEVIQRGVVDTITVRATNLNHVTKPVKGKLKVSFIRDFERRFGPSSFPVSDPVITDDEYRRLFPYDPLKISVTPEDKGVLVHTVDIDTEKSQLVPLPLSKKSRLGHYKLEFVSEGDSVSTKPILFDFVDGTQKTDSSKLFHIEQFKSPRKPGVVSFRLTSVVGKLYITGRSIGRDGVASAAIPIVLENNVAIVDVPYDLQRPPVSLVFESIFENNPYMYSTDISIPVKEPRLLIETEHFRNRIQPGDAEKWRFTITAHDTELQSEVLATLYDQSLETFASAIWTGPFINARRINRNLASVPFAFERGGHVMMMPRISQVDVRPETVQFNWFGFDFGQSFSALHQSIQKFKSARGIREISGVVSDATGPVPGANVVIKGQAYGVQTDRSGVYRIRARKNDVLLFSFLGMETMEVTVGKSKVMNVTLKDRPESIQEGVVAGALGIKRINEESDEQFAFQTTTVRMDQADDSNYYRGNAVTLRGNRSLTGTSPVLIVIDNVVATAADFAKLDPKDILNVQSLKGPQGAALYGSQGVNGVIMVTTKAAADMTDVQTRGNLAETAFFFPHLQPENGRLTLEFTAPESLTTWKLRMLAHNKKLASGYLEKLLVTAKSLSVVPNMPRFVRESDSLVIETKIVNNEKIDQNGAAQFEIFDASNQNLLTTATSKFTVAASGQTIVKWKIQIPQGLSGLQYRIKAKAGNFSDGEEGILPVLSSAVLITDAAPVWITARSSKNLSMPKINARGIQPHRLVLDITANPVIHVVESLPYLLEYEHECSEQTFARLYANSVASEILRSSPRISEMLRSWKKSDAETERSTALKSVLQAENPWFRESENDRDRKSRLATLLDSVALRKTHSELIQKLQRKQLASGGFAWFDGGSENRSITVHIAAGLGHLRKLSPQSMDNSLASLEEKLISNIDSTYLRLRKAAAASDRVDLNYLYARSFHADRYKIEDAVYNKILSDLQVVKREWLGYPLHEKALAALTLSRFSGRKAAVKILASLRETAISDDRGMYWLENVAGLQWNQAPIETQALLIEVFDELADDAKAVEKMKIWLLRQKKLQSWPTTKAATEGIYALLLTGKDWSASSPELRITAADSKGVTFNEIPEQSKVGTFRREWNATEITGPLAQLKIDNRSEVVVTGGYYFQYFQDMGSVSKAGAELQVSKSLYLKTEGNSGPILTPITDDTVLKAGDLVTIQLVVKISETVDYIHLKDSRAACFEPVDVLSGYKYEPGISYYRSTRDAATHFFFDELTAGTHYLTYDVRVNNRGAFTDGISTIQSMYAPEFTGHSSGTSVRSE